MEMTERKILSKEEIKEIITGHLYYIKQIYNNTSWYEYGKDTFIINGIEFFNIDGIQIIKRLKNGEVTDMLKIFTRGSEYPMGSPSGACIPLNTIYEIKPYE